MLNCHIVRDLLPSYLEHLTSPETEAELTEHLSTCPDCRAAKAAMEADLGVEKAPKPRRDFLRHLRWAAPPGGSPDPAVRPPSASGGSTGWSIPIPSPARRRWRRSSMRRSWAASPAPPRFPPTHSRWKLISMTPLKNRVFVLYRVGAGQGEFQYQGVAQFEKGVLGRYTVCAPARSSDWPIVQVRPIRVGRQDYLLADCTNAPEGAETFQVFAGYWSPSYEGEEVLDISKETPVREGRVRPDLLELVPITREQREAGFFAELSVICRDAYGNILDARELARTIRDSNQYGTPPASATSRPRPTTFSPA